MAGWRVAAAHLSCLLTGGSNWTQVIHAITYSLRLWLLTSRLVHFSQLIAMVQNTFHAWIPCENSSSWIYCTLSPLCLHFVNRGLNRPLSSLSVNTSGFWVCFISYEDGACGVISCIATFLWMKTRPHTSHTTKHWTTFTPPLLIPKGSKEDAKWVKNYILMIRSWIRASVKSRMHFWIIGPRNGDVAAPLWSK